MTTITEDYVSFEVAKLLKEKGFPQSTFRCHYIIDGNVHYKSFENRCGFGDYDIIAPTLAIAMKWLREVHNIHFLFDPYLDEDYNIRYSIIIVFGTNVVNPVYKTDGDFTYEQACDAAIKYCLKNLI